MNSKKTVIFGLLGTVLDGAGKREDRWEKWRPTVSLFQQEELLVHRFEFLHDEARDGLAGRVAADIATVSPETLICQHQVQFRDPWDFEEVYATLHDFMHGYRFDPEQEDYLIHITTGTHVAQICMFLLAESRAFPGKLIQTAPPRRGRTPNVGAYAIIDLDLSKYDRLASRFRQEVRDDVSYLKSGIETHNAEFNRLIERIERVALHSTAPLLLTGPTGAGKSLLARRIYELKHQRRQVTGPFVEVNCATLRGDAAMSALFGHTKGAFTGAVNDRPGLLRAADGGMLFLDEVGELGVDEQTMLLRAVEEKKFLPLGSDREAASSFQLICGTNRNLQADVAAGRFREDLLARINLWTFRLPGLHDRVEDIPPNLQYELDQFARAMGTHVTFNKEAAERFLGFAASPEALWTANFRDLNGAVVRMATLAPGGRITVEEVEEEIDRLKTAWCRKDMAGSDEEVLRDVLTGEQLSNLDRFDAVQLAEVVRVCRQSRMLSDAGRMLFAASRRCKKNANDADRLRKYLARFGIDWHDLFAE
jgi:transcriptional regulatory protein RtcR